MSHEPEYLISALRHFLNGEPLPDAADVDWRALLQLAGNHCVTPMLYAALRGQPLPDDIAAALRAEFEGCVQASLAQSAELARLAGIFEEHSVPVIFIKGPLLSRHLYENLGSRASSDIDLLVKREDLLRLRDVLFSKGYSVANTLHWEADSAYLRNREGEISFASPSGVSVDVHWRLLPGYYASPFDDLDVWESCRTTQLAGRPVRTLSPEHLLLLICSHSAKHAFERLGWICDVARFVTVTTNLDWALLMGHARHTRTMRQLTLALYLASDVLGARLPIALPEDPIAKRLATGVQDRIHAEVSGQPESVDLIRFCLDMMETSRQRARLLSGHYLTPSEAEYMALRLPPPLYLLYYPFRPARLIHKHVIKALL